MNYDKSEQRCTIFEIIIPKRLEYFGMLQEILEAVFDADKMANTP